jgi:1-acyl-sn-glycerol-3-phosphate acyltransferase
MEAVALPPVAEPNPALLRQCRAAFDSWERFASSRNGAALMFLWALAEAIVWPVIPDALLVPMAAGNRRRFYVPLAAAVCGSALGGLLLMLAAAWWPAPALAILEHLPLVTDRQIQTASHGLATRGALAFLAQPWSGVPLKVWGVMAGVHGIDPWSAIPLSIAARTLRMAIVATAARLIVGLLRSFLRDFSIYALAIYLVLFTYSWWQVMR